MDKVRAEFATKEAHASLLSDYKATAAVVRKLDKSIYTAIVILGVLVLFSRYAIKYLFE